MPSATPTTDERLRNYLDTNQLAREQLAVDLLAVDRRFSGVKPRHPRGGPDGGVDIDSTFGDQAAAAAVGFVNGATDSEDERKQLKAKYKADAQLAARRTPPPGMFVFFTNINLTLGEKSALQAVCAAAGIGTSEIFDRERMRVLLDSPDGLGIRYRHLQIPLSDAEQAAFFSRWGDEIQRVISSRFSSVESSLARIQFLYEAASPLDSFAVTAELDREYSAEELGHFRLVCSLHLREPKTTYSACRSAPPTTQADKARKSPLILTPARAALVAVCAEEPGSSDRGRVETEAGQAYETKERADSDLPRWKRVAIRLSGAKACICCRSTSDSVVA